MPISHSLQEIARALGGAVSNGQVLAPGPGHSAADRSLSVKLEANGPDGFVVFSFAGDDPIACRDYVRQKCGLPAFNGNGRPRASADEIAALVRNAVVSQRPDKPRGRLTATFNYVNEAGELLYQVLRYDGPKTFRQRRPDGDGGWIWNLDGVRRVPYRLPELLQYPDGTVFLTEGERDADRVASLGHCATTVASGKWTDACVAPLIGRNLIVLQDNDEPGGKKALEAAKRLHGVAKTVRIVLLPDLSEGGDVSDWLDIDPRRADTFVDLCFDTPLWEPPAAIEEQQEPTPELSEKPAEKPDGKRSEITPIRLTYFGGLITAAPKPWLIKNVIARGETSSWIAQPGKGKSALLTDIAVHAAASKDWRGYRTKRRSGVVIFALERADLVKRRLIAHRLRDQLPNLPIAVICQVLDLMSKSCVNVILSAIRQAEDHFGSEVSLAVIDTYSKGIAAGGGDESLARDQNIAVANLRRVLDQSSIHIATIGHTGKDESRGERGSNAKLADVDLLVHVTGDAIKTAVVKKANDQPEGVLTSFRLEPFDFGLDEDGDPFRTFILSDEVISGVKADQRALPHRQLLALEALTEITMSWGRTPPSEYQLPHGVKVVPAENWKAELLRRSVLDPNSKNPRARFSELLNALAVKRLIGVRDEVVWLVGPAGS